MRKELEDLQHGQSRLIDKLITCCKEVRVLRLELWFVIEFVL